MGKSPQSKATKKVEKSSSSTAAAASDQPSLRAAANEDICNEDHVWAHDGEDLIKEEKSTVQAEDADVLHSLLHINHTYVHTQRTSLVATSFSNQFSVSDCSTTSTRDILHRS